MLAAFLAARDITSVSGEMALTVPLIPHRTQLARVEKRRLQAVPDPDLKQVDALYQGYGTHYVDIWCGSPPQRQTVIVDTGSGLAGFPCEGCQDCGEAPAYHIDKVFDQNASNTFQEVVCTTTGGCMSNLGKCQSEATEHQCQIGVSYSCTNRFAAFEALDRCYLGGLHNAALDNVGEEFLPGVEAASFRRGDWDPSNAATAPFEIDEFLFGCQTEVRGVFRNQLADGILGMDAGNDSYWQQLHRAGKLPERKFSLCFSRQQLKEREGTEAGGLTLGGSDTRWHDTPMQFAKMEIGRNNWFTLKIRRIMLQNGDSRSDDSASRPRNAVTLDILPDALNNGDVIVDSGTTDTFLDPGMRVEFKRAFKELTGQEFSEHYKKTLTLHELHSLPTVVFQFEGLEKKERGGTRGHLDAVHFDDDNPNDIYVAFPPSHYMELLSPMDIHHSMKRTYGQGLTFGGKGTVLGANFIMGHDVEFDFESGRMGWSESSCNYTRFAGHDFLEGEKYQRVTEKKTQSPELTPTSGIENNGGSSLFMGIAGIVGAAILVASVVVKRTRSPPSETTTTDLELVNLSQEQNTLELESFRDEI